MRPLSAVLIAVALLGAGGATLTAKKVIEKRAQESAARQEEMKRDVEVLVLARNLNQGHVLEDSDLKWERWPLVTAQATKVVTREEGKTPLEHLSPGTVLRRAMLAQEPIFSDSVFKPGKHGLMPGLIAPGMRAVGIKVDAEAAVSGFVLPGDRVDVLALIDLSKTASSRSSGGARFVGETILEDVKVLAIDQEFSPSESGSKSSKTKKKKKDEKKKDDKDKEVDAVPGEVAMVGKTVAVEVTPAQAERLLAAKGSAKLSLALRSLADGTEQEPRGIPFTSDLDASVGIRYAGGNGIRIIKGERSGR